MEQTYSMCSFIDRGKWVNKCQRETTHFDSLNQHVNESKYKQGTDYQNLINRDIFVCLNIDNY